MTNSKLQQIKETLKILELTADNSVASGVEIMKDLVDEVERLQDVITNITNFILGSETVGDVVCCSSIISYELTKEDMEKAAIISQGNFS